MKHPYYSRFKIITHNPLWRVYLRWAYQTCIDDLLNEKINIKFNKKDFTALLCGTSGEVTSSEFANFIFSKNPKAKLIILDVSEVQLAKSKEVLKEKFPNKKIRYVQANALNTKIKNSLIDYIETDGFPEYFSKKDLRLLFDEWKRILRKKGFITTRAFASKSFFGGVIDACRIFAAKNYLNVKIHIHRFSELEDIFKKSGLLYVYGGLTFCPTFRRFSFYNK